MISVIIITYQRSKYITRAINSVLNQTHKDFEIIVVDDNNPDTIHREELEKIMLQYKDLSNVRYIQHKCNMNGSAARNTGIYAAKGEYVAFLDDDDYFLPTRLEKLSFLLENNHEYNGVYSSVIVTQNKQITGFIEATKIGNMKTELLLDRFAFGTGSNLFFRIDTVKKMKGFDESFLRHQDIEFMLRFFDDNLLLPCPEPLVVKVQDDRSNEINLEKLIDVKEKYFKVFSNDIDQLTILDREIFYQVNYSQLLDNAIVSRNFLEFLSLKKEFENFVDLSWKNYFRFFQLFVNNYIKIEKIKYFIIRKNVLNKFENEVKIIENIESFNYE